VLASRSPFSIGTLWGARFYRPELFESTEPFLVLFFAMYLIIPILFARKRAPELKSYVDGTLIFGTPLVAFGLQTQLVRNIEYGAAWSALVLSGIYLLLARWLFMRNRDALRLLVEAFLALGVGVRHARHPTRIGWALDLGHVGAGRCCDPVDRLAPESARGTRLRIIPAARGRLCVSCSRSAAAQASLRCSTVSIWAACL
jgi:hypothetical protein